MNLRPPGYEPDELPTALLRVVKNGGGRWIRTIEVVDNRFTVCPLWPLGNPSTKIIQEKKWSRLWDSNPQPADYKSAALPIELNRLANVHYYTKITPICQQYFRNISPISAKICIIFTITAKICWNWLLHRQYCRNTAPYGRLYRPTN